jgi:hypothetical protein
MVDAVSKQYLRQMTFIIYLDEHDPEKWVELDKVTDIQCG